MLQWPLTRREFCAGMGAVTVAGCDVKRSILFPSRSISIPQITTASLPPANQNAPYSFQLTGTGGTYPTSWSAVFSPNTGGQFSINSTTGVISGTPTVVETETVTVQLTDNMTPHNVAVAVFTLPVNSGVVISTTSPLPGGTVGSPYSTTLAATGGTPPYTWAMSPPTLDGLTLSSAGVLSGTPTSATTASANFTATDSLAVPSAPVSLSFTATVAGGIAPARIWRGPVTSAAASMVTWPPATGTPDSYNLYRSDAGGPFHRVNSGPILVTTNASLAGPGGAGPGFDQVYFVDGNTPGNQVTPGPLTQNTAYTYYWTAVTAGAESPPGPQMTVTTLNGTNSPTTLPIPPLDPQTWVQPYAIPTGGTTWTATITTDPAAHTGIAGTGAKGNVNCSFQYALNNCAPGDVIVLTAGASYTSGSSNGAWAYPLLTGPQMVYVISSQADPSLPGYNGAAAKLPAYSFSTRQGGLNYVQPSDKAAMPLMFMGSGGSGPTPNLGLGHVFPAGGGYFRFVGIAFVPNPSDFTANLVAFISTAHGNFATPQAISNQIYFDRCYFGNDSANYLSTFSIVLNGITSNINGLFVHQCYFQGFYNWANEAHGVGLQAGGPVCIQNNYIEVTSEGVLAGGLYTAETQPVQDIVYRYNTNFKQPAWFNTNFGTFTLTAPPSSGAGGGTATVTTAWPNQKVRVAIVFSTGQTLYGFISNGPGAGQSTLTWQNAITGTPTATVTLYNPMGLWVKNHFEMKIGQRAACYGNVHTNCSNGFAGQQPGNSFNIGPRAVGSSATPTNPIDTNPWDFITDVDIHDNVLLNVGEAGHIFSADNARVTSYIDRVRFANNLVYVNPPIYVPNPVITHGWGLDSAGPTTNYTVDHNTFIVNPANVSASSSSFTHGSFGLPNSPLALDRPTFTNNVMDGGIAFECGIGSTTGGTAAFNIAVTNCVQGGNPSGQPSWSGNITVSDSRVYPSGTLATNVGYAALVADMAKFVNNATPPTTGSDWNVITGPYARAATDTGPIGSEFGTLAQDLFPRTFWQAIAPGAGSGVTYAYANPTYQTNAAKFNIVNPGAYMGIEQTMGNTTFATIFANIKSQALANGIDKCRCILYVMSSEQSTVGGGGNASTYTVWSSLVDTTNWWIRTSYPAGSIVIFDANSGLLGITSQNAILSGAGKNIFQGFWNHYDGVLRQGNAVSQGYAAGLAFAANPNLDGYQMDNVFCTPRSTGAWGMDTTSYAAGNATAASFIQKGQASQVAALKAINPNLIVLCNADYFVHSTSNFTGAVVTLDSTQQGLMDIVYCQSAIGTPNGIEGQGVTTTAQFMQNLIAAESQMAPNGTLIFEQTGPSHGAAFSSANQSLWTAADWRAVRFGMGCCFMRNWHYALNFSENYSPTAPYFADEMLTQNGLFGWLGHPIDPPQSAARTNGVWWRKFEKGVVFMNPAGNGTQTLTLATLGLSGLSAIAQASPTPYGDPLINTGAPVTSITLQARDGRFLKYT